jgi:hypothetical protein
VSPEMAQALGTAARILHLPPWKTCGHCERDYSKPEWGVLPLLGVTDCGDGFWLVLRNCVGACRGTMGIELSTKVAGEWLALTGVLAEMAGLRAGG